MNNHPSYVRLISEMMIHRNSSKHTLARADFKSRKSVHRHSKNGERDIITFKNLHYAEGEGHGTEDKYMELELDLDREGKRGGNVFEKSTT